MRYKDVDAIVYLVIMLICAGLGIFVLGYILGRYNHYQRPYLISFCIISGLNVLHFLFSRFWRFLQFRDEKSDYYGISKSHAITPVGGLRGQQTIVEQTMTSRIFTVLFFGPSIYLDKAIKAYQSVEKKNR